jgi:hypothetical protein
MPRTAQFAERIGKVFLPEADTIQVAQDTPNPFDPRPGGGLPFPLPDLPFPREPLELQPFLPRPWDWFPRFCSTSLKQGCYTISFVPAGTSIFSTRFRGTLRVEHTGSGPRISADLYRYRLFDDIVVGPVRNLELTLATGTLTSDNTAADTGGTIPIYSRRSYHSYLKGTGAQLFKFVLRGTPCSFTLNFDEFVYNHPATGFSGTFNNTRTRAIRFEMQKTATADVYTGQAFEGTTLLGTVSLRWISERFRRAHLQIHTLQGAQAPPATVGTASFASIWADIGWDLTVTDGGTVTLPAALSGVNINTCWAGANLHALMQSVPGYNAADLDTVWRSHLVAVPAQLGCGRGVMFDSGGGDPNGIAREGSATFSHDGYPANEVPDGMGGSHYDGAANQQQRNVPRAFLRSAAHEVGHAFNQIHQGFEGGNDNSIMTPTPGVAQVIGLAGTFPNAINLGFNATVTRHLRHLPDPAVRPGAMNFFGSAINAPEAADVAWLEPLAVTISLSSDRVALGEPLTLGVELTNTSDVPIPVPDKLDVGSLTLRVNVTDPSGRVTFMRPAVVDSCPHIVVKDLAPGKSVKGSTVLFWGTDGFAFDEPGRHMVEVIALWDVAGVPVGTSADRDVFVSYPVTENDNKVAALLLDPAVGAAVARRRVWAEKEANRRVTEAMRIARGHRACRALADLDVLKAPRASARRAPAARRGAKRPVARARRRS